MEKLIRGISTFLDLLKVRYLGKRIPLAIAWAVTRRCNYKCKYCAVWKTPAAELDTGEIRAVIDEMAGMGVKKITFTGGEPLLRGDMGEIIDYAHQKNISVNLNSNGSLIKERISDLKNLSSLTLSLEGPEEVHDALRQKGSFKTLLEAIDIASQKNIKVVLTATLNTYNLNYIDYLLELATQYNVQIQFQPSTKNILDDKEDNPVSLSQAEYNEAMQKIIERKKRGYKKIIRNSPAGLNHLSQWPNLKKIRCASGLITGRIEPDGRVIHCDTFRNRNSINTLLNCKKDGFRNAFYGLPIISCDDCCCALRVEASYILKLNISALTNAYFCER